MQIEELRSVFEKARSPQHKPHNQASAIELIEGTPESRPNRSRRQLTERQMMSLVAHLKAKHDVPCDDDLLYKFSTDLLLWSDRLATTESVAVFSESTSSSISRTDYSELLTGSRPTQTVSSHQPSPFPARLFGAHERRLTDPVETTEPLQPSDLRLTVTAPSPRHQARRENFSMRDYLQRLRCDLPLVPLASGGLKL